MGEKEKVTIMVLKVDLQCDKCYRKVKKVLCKFPQIRDQTYDEKNNLVIIKVVCCSPEKVRDKLCCKGGGAIKSIEIKEPEKPKPLPAAEKPKEKPKEAEKPKPVADKPKEAEKPKEKPKEAEKPKEKPKEAEKPKEKPKEVAPAPAPAPAVPVKPAPAPAPVPAYPPVTVNACCIDCYGGHPGGPCQTGYGYAYGQPAPYIQYDGYYGRPVYDSYGGGRNYTTSSYCVTRPDCFSEENPQACAIM